jgi:tetratricopeptide (TPR) repeat protein
LPLFFANVSWNECIGPGCDRQGYHNVGETIKAEKPELWKELKSNDLPNVTKRGNDDGGGDQDAVRDGVSRSPFDEVPVMSVTRCPSVLVVMVALLTSLQASRCLGDPPAAASSANATTFEAVGKDIAESVLRLGYSKSNVDDLVPLVRGWGGWKCEQWKEDLSKARAGNTAEAARVEEEAVKALAETIAKEIPFDAGSQYFHLSKIVVAKKANGFGYSQLFYVLGDSVGLNVTVINALESASGLPLAGEVHVACSVSLSDGRLMIVDVAQHYLSKPFVFKETFREAGNYWELKQKDNPLGLPRRIQFSDESGLVGMIYDGLANEYARTNHPKEAVAYATKAVELNPRFAEAYFHRGAYHNALGQYAQAIPDCTRAIVLNPTFALAYVIRGMAYRQSGEAQKAISDLSKALELNPTMAEGFIARGSVYDVLEQYAKAISDYTKAIELNPKAAQAYFNRGIACVKSGQTPRAISDFTKVIDLEPKVAQGYFVRGVANASLGKVDDAKADLRRATELNPNLRTEVRKVSSQYQLGL